MTDCFVKNNYQQFYLILSDLNFLSSSSISRFNSMNCRSPIFFFFFYTIFKECDTFQFKSIVVHILLNSLNFFVIVSLTLHTEYMHLSPTPTHPFVFSQYIIKESMSRKNVSCCQKYYIFVYTQ